MVRANAALVALAAMCWGLSGGIGGILMADGWDPFVISLYRGAIGLLFVLIWLILRPRECRLPSRQFWFWSVVAGLGVAGNFAFYFLSIEQSSVTIAATLMYCAPVFVYLISFLLRLEQPTILKWVAIVMVMTGIVLLTRIYATDTSSATLAGTVSGLLAGLSYAVFIFGFKYAAPQGSPQAILVIVFAIVVSVLIWPSDMNQVTLAINTTAWPMFALLGTLGAGLSFILYVIGINHTAPAVASVLAMVEPVTASLFGVVFLNESLGDMQLLGMGLILITVTALSANLRTRINLDASR